MTSNGLFRTLFRQARTSRPTPDAERSSEAFAKLVERADRFRDAGQYAAAADAYRAASDDHDAGMSFHLSTP